MSQNNSTTQKIVKTKKKLAQSEKINYAGKQWKRDNKQSRYQDNIN